MVFLPHRKWMRCHNRDKLYSTVPSHIRLQVAFDGIAYNELFSKPRCVESMYQWVPFVTLIDGQVQHKGWFPYIYELSPESLKHVSTSDTHTHHVRNDIVPGDFRTVCVLICEIICERGADQALLAELLRSQSFTRDISTDRSELLRSLVTLVLIDQSYWDLSWH